MFQKRGLPVQAFCAWARAQCSHSISVSQASASIFTRLRVIEEVVFYDNTLFPKGGVTCSEAKAGFAELFFSKGDFDAPFGGSQMCH